MRPVSALLVATLAVLVAEPVLAQAPAQPCTYGINAYASMAVSMGPEGAFSGTIQTTLEWKLYDGTVLQGGYVVQRARDGKGRTYTENAVYCERDQDGNTHLRKGVNVFDPATRTSLNWMVGTEDSGVANLMHSSATPRHRNEPRPQPLFRAWGPPQTETREEQLGAKNIAGVATEGKRTTRTIPAGEEGNSQPITVVDEHWYSKDLHMDVAVMHDDPRSGKVTSEFTTLTLAEPDASVFQPPTNYTIRDRTPSETATPAP